MKERLRAPTVGWRAEDGPRGDELAASGLGLGEREEVGGGGDWVGRGGARPVSSF